MKTPGTLAAIVADDHEMFRGALAEFLKREVGFGTVAEAGSLEEVFDHLRRTPDVTLASIDLSMPGVDGAASLQRVRDLFPNLRLVVITGSERREDILLALGAGVHGYIPKTFRLAELASALRTVMEGRIFVPSALATKILQPAESAAKPQVQVRLGASAHGLSPRQREVLRLMTVGKSNKEIARELHLAEGTVKVHVNALFRALGAHNRLGAIAAMARLSEANTSASMPR